MPCQFVWQPASGRRKPRRKRRREIIMKINKERREKDNDRLLIQGDLVVCRKRKEKRGKFGYNEGPFIVKEIAS